MTLALPDKIRNVSDSQWLKMLISSTTNPIVNGIEFPGFPAEQLQTTFVGSANEKALREAFVFYSLVKETAAKGNLFGCDVSQSIVYVP